VKENPGAGHGRIRPLDFGGDYNWVVVSNIFYFHHYLGKITNLTNILGVLAQVSLGLRERLGPRGPATSCEGRVGRLTNHLLVTLLSFLSSFA